MTASNGVGRVPRALRRRASGPGVLLVVVSLSLPALAAEPALTLHANAVAGADVPLTIDLFRWSEGKYAIVEPLTPDHLESEVPGDEGEGYDTEFYGGDHSG